MKKNNTRGLMHSISFLGFFLWTNSAYAGEVIRPDTESDFQWKSTECLKPTPPPISSDRSSSNRLTKYALDIELYIDCLQREAQSDYYKAQILMQEAVQNELKRQTRVMDEMMRQAAKTMR